MRFADCCFVCVRKECEICVWIEHGLGLFFWRVCEFELGHWNLRDIKWTVMMNWLYINFWNGSLDILMTYRYDFDNQGRLKYLLNYDFEKKKYPSVNYIAHCPIADLLNGIGSEQNIYSHYLTTKLYNVIQLYTNYSQHTCNHILWRSI